MGRPIKLTQSSSIDKGYNTGYGGTIGAGHAITSVYTIAFNYKTAGNVLVTNGYASAQKGAQKFTVANAAGGQTTSVYLVNPSSGFANMAANTAAVLCYNTSNVSFYAKRITDHWVKDWSGNRYVYKSGLNVVATANWANVATN